MKNKITRKEMLEKVGLFTAGLPLLNYLPGDNETLSIPSSPGALKKSPDERFIGAFNEWGKLREAVVGISDETLEIDYIPTMQWLPPGRN